jgi:hypothetical protein
MIYSLYSIYIYKMFVGAANANRFLKRSIFHPGSTKCEEQKREAREDYGRFFFIFSD